jgi:hypothetical protein
LLTSTPEHRAPREFEVTYVGASADLSHVFFEANDSLTGEVSGVAPTAPAVSAGENDLYEWQPTTGQVALVNVLPGNTTGEPNAMFPTGSAHPISATGDHVFWSSQSGQLYVREDGDQTKEIQDHSGRFLSASSDGSRVLLTDGCLYSLQTEACEDLTLDTAHSHQGGFLGLAGQGEDLTHLYFVDSAVLTSEPRQGCLGELSETEMAEEEATHEGRCRAKTGKDNLYAWTQGSNTTFVATIEGRDDSGSGVIPVTDWTSVPDDRTAEASPDGEWFAFLSNAPLTGYDNTGPCESNHANGRVPGSCPEAFLYNASTDALRCVSCDPTGARPLGGSSLRLIDGPGYLPQPRYLTDQGRLFFDTGDSLVAADTNEGVEDVYEYEPASGSGEPQGDTCHSTVGCISLISNGSGTYDANFLAADPTGANVFFTTRNKLLGRDTDEQVDLYDARENGGIPGETAAEQAPCRVACQAPTSVPSIPTPGSESYEGAGNIQQTAPVVKKKVSKKHGATGHSKRKRKKAKRKRSKGKLGRVGKRTKASRGGVK